MPWREVPPAAAWGAMEERVLAFWRERDVFPRSMSQREGSPPFVFYEGPPTANGRPGAHHVLSRVFKDVFPRFQTMRGRFVDRRGGWDCHGLPVEIEVEKLLGISGKPEIEAYGIAEFNAICRESVVAYVDEWERLTERIGFWIDTDRAYRTMDPDYIESVWWSLAELYRRDLLYRSDKVVPYCPRCGTALSSHEVALGYMEVEDPSVYVRFRLRGAADESLLVWTTTPWTLPANQAVAINPSVRYAAVEHGGETLILAEPLVHEVLGEDARILRTMDADELLGREYEPPFPYVRGAHRVVEADFVTIVDGTGIVHIAPAFGEDDMATARGARAGRPQPGGSGRPLLRDGAAVGRPRGEGGRPRPRRRPRCPRAPAPGGGPPPLLPALLALRDPAPLLRQALLVHPHDGRARPHAGAELAHRLASRARARRALRALAGGQRRLGDLARPLLGHPAAALALRRLRPRGRDRVLRRAPGACSRAGARRPRPPPALR